MKVPYSTQYIPPAPILTLTLQLPDDNKTVGPIKAIVDTGADATLVPVGYLRELGATIWDEAYLRSQWGERRRIFTYLLDIRIGDYTFPGVVVVGDNQGQEMILGRTLLNQLILLLDGPQVTLRILTQLPHHLE
ncbi:MAG TPA: retropepsin-like aspartic protease [Anaerolineae bacterium]|nr:retropepsin-like aspartic protease [Anaerolineae bacterium]HQI84624.1 retropepsin-like aspartic protease [Anaerolineae bacterium]